jgi:AcrR family transcriptional regulator
LNTQRSTRFDNRRQHLLDAAAALFAAQGFKGTSIRDIAQAVGMLPGSVYYHFPSKDALLLAVYREGVERIAAQVGAAVASSDVAWGRLEAACQAHLQTLFEHSDYAQVVIRIQPRDAEAIADQLVVERDRYESLYKDLIDELNLPPHTDKKHFRLLLLGALNWSQVWYRADRDSPRKVAQTFVRLLRNGQD